MGLLKKIIKFLKIARRWDYLLALRHGVAAAIEHERVLRMLSCNTIVDVGGNRGQFALAARHWCPEAKIISFEPLPKPCEKFLKLFSDDENVCLHPVAIGYENNEVTIHVSCQDDSSSLLPITHLQETLFPGTKEKETKRIQVKTLDAVITPDEIITPALLKLDVQGYELYALQGCDMLLSRFAYIYVECSFLELYAGQVLADEIIAYLKKRNFRLKGVYNTIYDKQGRGVQADFLFERPRKVCR